MVVVLVAICDSSSSLYTSQGFSKSSTSKVWKERVITIPSGKLVMIAMNAAL
jgi:hypothetical protein